MTNIYPFSLNFTIQEPDGVSIAFFNFIKDNNPIEKISCIVSTRTSGGSIDRQRLFKTLGLEYDCVAFVKQIHSRKTVEIKNHNDYGAEADGLVTGDRFFCLSVTVADCLPVYLYDTRTNAFGVLHSGWKGTGIVLNALELMKEKWGTAPEDVAAILGPCIKSCCYQVDKERAAVFENEFGKNSRLLPPDAQWPLGPVTVCHENGFYLDMQAANARLLAGAGVRDISVCQNCTFTDTRLGSFRREGQNFSRMIAMAGFFSSHNNHDVIC